MPEPTLAQRLVRAQAKIAHSGIPYRVPEGHLLGERLPGVLAVLYLLFSEGYTASSGDDLVRVDLAEEAIRVTRLLVRLMAEGVPDPAPVHHLPTELIVRATTGPARR